MSSAANDWDLVEQLVFECLELLADERDLGATKVDALLADQPADIAAEVRRVLARISELPPPVPGDTDDLRVPERLGPYTLGRRLGQGGMGAVYEAVDESLGRRVAIKVVRPDLLALGGARERFRREVEAVARLSHAGIVPVYQVGEDGGVPWFAMELVPGASLAEVLHRLRGRDPATLVGADLWRAAHGESVTASSSSFEGSWERSCVRLVRELADALTHAHGRSVLHRDVKPSNVLIDTAGHARLFDFGLARAEGTVELTRTGAVVGSLPYMPPEQLRGDGAEADARADVYALGVTLYELLTLHSPFLGESEAATRRNVEQGHPASPRQWHRHLSWEAVAVTSIAIDRDPLRRYQSMAEFAADLQRMLDRRPIVGRPPGPWLRLRRSAERHPVVATAVVALLLAVIALVAVYAFGLRQERDRALAAQAEAERLGRVDRVRGYRAGVQAAHMALRLGQAAAAREQLDRCPEELREFEWRHLAAQTDESLRTVALSDAFLRRVVVTRGGLFAAGADGSLRHVTMGDFTVEEFTPPSGATVLALAATHDGRHVVSGHLDHQVRLWDGPSRTLRAEISFADLYGDRELAARHRACFAVAISADGATAYATSAGGAVAVIDLVAGVRAGGFLLPIVRGGLFALAVSPHGDTLAVGYDHEIRLLGTDGSERRTLRGHRGFVFSLAFSADGDYLLSGSQDRTARIWRVADGEPGVVLFGHDGEVHQATFGHDGTVWTASNDATLRNWDLATGRERQRRLGHANAVYGVAVAKHEGRQLALTAGWDGTLRVWDAVVGKARSRIGGPGRTLRQRLLVHHGGSRCTVVDDGNGVRTFALPSGERLEPLVAGTATAVAVHGDRVVAVRDGVVRRQPDDEPLRGASGEVQAIRFLADGTLVASQADGQLLFWPAFGGVGELHGGHEGAVSVLLPIAAHGCLSAGEDGRVLLWAGRQSRQLLVRENPWDGAALSPDGQVAYLAGLGRVLAVETGTGNVRWEREVAGRMRDLATASGGARLLVAGTDRVLHVLDAGDGEEVLGLPADNLLQSVAVVDEVAVTATVYSEVDLWFGR